MSATEVRRKCDKRPGPSRPARYSRGVIARYSRPAMARVWSDEAKLARWLEVELAALDGFAEIGEVPREAAEAIRAGASRRRRRASPRSRSDTQHDLAAFVDAVAEQLGPEGRWLHYGLTSSDVLDTALALQVREAGELILDGIERALAAVTARAQEHRDTICIGRTHGVHAEPTTFGLKLAVWAFELDRGRARRRAGARGHARRQALRRGRDLRGDRSRGRARRLRAARARARRRVSTQIIQRDRHAELLARARARRGVAREVRARDPPPRAHRGRARSRSRSARGQKGSSAMPHKRNPIIAERICGLARVVRGRRARRARERRALARARHLALLGRARRRSRTRSSRSTTCSTASPGSSRAWSSAPSACGGTSSEPRPLLQPAAAARARRVGARARRRLPPRAGERDARLGRGARLPRARRAPTPRRRRARRPRRGLRPRRLHPPRRHRLRAPRTRSYRKEEPVHA